MPIVSMKHELSHSKHLRIYETLALRITTGQYVSGQQLPTMNMLSQSFEASKPTIAKALSHLEKKGLINRKRGGGVFVHDDVVPKQQIKPIGLLIPDLITRENMRVESIFTSIFSHVLTYAKERNFFLVADSYGVDSNAILDDIKKSFDNFAHQNCAGVFFHFNPRDDSRDLSEKVLDVLEQSQKPVVLFDRDICQFPKRSKFDLIGINNERAAYVLTSHLIDLDCKKFCFLKAAFDTYSPVVTERISGYQTALIQNQLSPDNIVELTLNDNENEVSKILTRLVRDEKVEALVCVNDEVAIKCMEHLLRNGIRIPEDVRLVGFDDLPSSQMLSVPLTTICQPVDLIASEAVYTISERLNAPDRPAREIMLHEKLIIRQSSGATLPHK